MRGPLPSSSEGLAPRAMRHSVICTTERRFSLPTTRSGMQITQICASAKSIQATALGAISADIACPATAELSPFVPSRQCPRLQSQVSGEHVQADWSHQGEHHCVIVNIAPGIAVSLIGVEVRAGR